MKWLSQHCEICPAKLWFWQGYAVIFKDILDGWGIIGTRRYRVCSALCVNLLYRHRKLGVR